MLACEALMGDRILSLLSKGSQLGGEVGKHTINEDNKADSQECFYKVTKYGGRVSLTGNVKAFVKASVRR